MTDFSLRAARIQLGALLAALALAILIALGITTGAFVLSFAVQRDLARQATIPEHLTWIFPAIVDSAIFGATIAIVILSKLKMSWWDKGFYIALAVSVVVISILGNAYHAFHAAGAAQATVESGGVVGFVPLDPAIAALIAVIPPVLVLAFTHGIGILIKATGIAYTDYRAQIDIHGTDVDATDIEPERKAVADVAPSSSVDETIIDSAVEISESVGDLDQAPAQSADRETLPSGSLHDLVTFIDSSDLSTSVKDTARRKLADPNLTWETIAQDSVPAVATSTAWRRYEKFDTAARAAGFTSPPLPDLRAAENTVEHAADLNLAPAH
ncbi:hypothetical protein B2J88_41205 [Rhodococcus sp. SRB_17]|nr:hypothetical protein [Rhodococcus sp. SRB_17]